MTPTIRPAADADSGQVVSLIAACWVRYPGNVLDIAGEEPGLRAVALHYAAKRGRFWVATLPFPKTEGITGCVGVVPTPANEEAKAELVRLYVHPRLRRQGLARRLAALAEAQAREWGAEAVDLWSDTRFREAHAFYQALGYTQTGETRDLHDLSNSTEYHFIKRLDSLSQSLHQTQRTHPFHPHYITTSYGLSPGHRDRHRRKDPVETQS